MLRVLTRRALGFMLGARRPGPPPADVVTFDGRIALQPPDTYTDGGVWLTREEGHVINLIDYLYQQLEIPREAGSLPHVAVRGKITVEIHAEPDANWLLG
jgi:hypothetical protein